VNRAEGNWNAIVRQSSYPASAAPSGQGRRAGQQPRRGPQRRLDGLLLYPALDLPIRNAIFLGDFSCSVATLGLAEPWTTLTARMRAIAFH
jgi:hypothetical protein